MREGNELYFLEDNLDFDNPLAFDFSDAGAAIMDDMMMWSVYSEEGGYDSLYTVEDAIARFEEEIDYHRGRIEEAYHGISTVTYEAMECPIGSGFEDDIQRLNWTIIAEQEILEMLETDLGMLIGREVVE